MRIMTDTKSFYKIHKDSAEFIAKTCTNFEMRRFISSYGYHGSYGKISQQSAAQELIDMHVANTQPHAESQRTKERN